jgi:sigma-B regulation protein RsbU (phosphoserine phosphatase)
MNNRTSELYTDLLLQRQALFTYASDLFLLVETSGEIVESNKKAALVFGRELTGSLLQDITGSPDLPLEIVTGREVVRTMHLRSRTEQGSKVSLLLTFVPLTQEDQVRHIMVVGKDLREKESLTDEIERLRARVHDLENSAASTASGSGSGSGDAVRQLESVNQQLEEINRRLTKELEMASLLQHSLVPKSIQPGESLHISFFFRPMELVGGDFYDVFELDGSRRGVFIADVSGHGITSAFIAAMLKISFRNYASKYVSPARVLRELNREYCQVIQTGDYLTACYMVFDPARNRLTYSGAAHPDALLLRSGGGVQALPSQGFFIGMFHDAEYEETSVDFNEGDQVLLFTDGILEAFSDKADEQFGMERLKKCLERDRSEGSGRLIERIAGDLQSFMQGSRYFDDLAMVAVEFRRKAAS